MTIRFTAQDTLVNGAAQEEQRNERQKLALALKVQLGLKG